MQRSKLISIILVVLVILWFVGGYFRKEHREDAVNALAMGSVRVEVINSKAHLHPVYLTLRGVTEAESKVILRAEIAGPVEKILKDAGDFVKTGETLLKIALKDLPAKLEEAKATVESKKIEYNAAETLFEKDFTPKTSVAKAKASFEEAKAHLKEIELSIQETTIKAPFSGIIDSEDIDIGQYVDVGDTLLTLVDLDPINTVIPVSEEKISLLKMGQKSKIKPINGPAFEGEVTYISRVADPATRTYQVELSSKNPDYLIPDGMTIEASIPVGKTEAHFISPSILSLDESGTIGLKFVDFQNIVHFVPVTIVDTETDGIWVSDLPQDVKIIVTGQEFIKSGETVVPVLVQVKK